MCLGDLVQQEFPDAHRIKSQISMGYNLAISLIEGLEGIIVLTERKVPSVRAVKISEISVPCSLHGFYTLKALH